MKTDEAYKEKIQWHANRLLSKINYVIHTDAIKTYIVPNLTKEQTDFVYSNEADVLNVALFGISAKQWRKNNPELSKNGNIRDYADLLQLVILNNLENTNAELIRQNIPQNKRLMLLNQSAKKQMEVLKNNKNIEKLKKLQEYADNSNLF